MEEKEAIIGTKIGELLISDLGGNVVIRDEFLNLHFVTRLDALSDWISSLQNLYDDILDECKEPQNDS